MPYKELEELKEKVKLIQNKSPEDITYEDRYYLWVYNYLTDSSYRIDGYTEGEEVCIYDGLKLLNGEIKDGFGNDFPEWFKAWGKHFGKEVLVKTSGKIYKLVGMSYTYLDYYYILESKDGQRHFESCVGVLIII